MKTQSIDFYGKLTKYISIIILYTPFFNIVEVYVFIQQNYNLLKNLYVRVRYVNKTQKNRTETIELCIKQLINV